LDKRVDTNPAVSYSASTLTNREDTEMQRVTIEYITAAGNCKSATGTLMGYCTDGDVWVMVNGRKRKGMPVEWL
jgi:hypothetical protein